MNSRAVPKRYIHLPGGPVKVGQLAGTSVRHPHVPDGNTGTLCMACWGWCNDPRHTGQASLRRMTS